MSSKSSSAVATMGIDSAVSESAETITTPTSRPSHSYVSRYGAARAHCPGGREWCD
jgi:hypothetical protein